MIFKKSYCVMKEPEPCAAALAPMVPWRSSIGASDVADTSAGFFFEKNTEIDVILMVLSDISLIFDDFCFSKKY